MSSHFVVQWVPLQGPAAAAAVHAEIDALAAPARCDVCVANAWRSLAKMPGCPGRDARASRTGGAQHCRGGTCERSLCGWMSSIAARGEGRGPCRCAVHRAWPGMAAADGAAVTTRNMMSLCKVSRPGRIVLRPCSCASTCRPRAPPQPGGASPSRSKHACSRTATAAALRNPHVLALHDTARKPRGRACVRAHHAPAGTAPQNLMPPGANGLADYVALHAKPATAG